MPAINLTQDEIDDLIRKGIIPAEKAAPRKKPVSLVSPFFDCVGPGVMFLVPVATVSEANGRAWRERSNRTKQARHAVAKVCGPNLRHLATLAEHYHRGGALTVRLTRLGGKRLDALSNLGVSLKSVEDVVAMFLAADDGDPRWKAVAAQEAGPLVGVRVEIQPLDFPEDRQ